MVWCIPKDLFQVSDVGGNISETLLSDLLSHGRKLVKVLDLNDAELERIPDEVFKLFHLKYLSLSSTNVKYVPKSIGMVQSLETLDLNGTGGTELPIEMQKLEHLRHLLLPYRGVRASFKIGKLKSLQTLCSIRTVTEIGKLLQLRELGIMELKREDGKELCSSLGNLTQLRKLIVCSANDEEDVIDFEDLKSSDLPRLQVLLLRGCLEKQPEWISSLHGLTTINLVKSKLSDDPLQCLHDLPNLISLDLWSAYEGDSLCFKAGGFPKLDMLRLYGLQKLRWVTVEENAMPSLKELEILGCQSMEDIPTGIENLKHLQQLEFKYMSNEFENKLKNLDKESAAYERLLQIPTVLVRTSVFSGGQDLHLDKESGTFKPISGIV